MFCFLSLPDGPTRENAEMSNTPPIPPAPASGEPTPPGLSPSANRPDAHAFFQEYYEGLVHVPVGRTDREIRAFESRYGTNTGYTRDELGEIAKLVRAEMRQTQRKPNDTTQGVPTENLRRSERWIRRIGFGAFLLAAIGVLFYALAIRQIEPNLNNLRPFLIVIVSTAVLLFILDFGRHHLMEVKHVQWIAKYLAIGVASVFMLIAFVVALWLVIFILQDAGVIFKPVPTYAQGQPVPTAAPGQMVERKKPERVVLSAAEVYGSRSHGRWMDAIKSHLQEEGDAEMRAGGIKDFRLLWVKTEPWPHATPKLELQLGPAFDWLTLTGYAFRVHPVDSVLYQAIPTKREENKWTFSVPECDKNDYLVFILRASLSSPGSFPKDTTLLNLLEVTLR